MYFTSFLILPSLWHRKLNFMIPCTKSSSPLTLHCSFIFQGFRSWNSGWQGLCYHVFHDNMSACTAGFAWHRSWHVSIIFQGCKISFRLLKLMQSQYPVFSRELCGRRKQNGALKEAGVKCCLVTDLLPLPGMLGHMCGSFPSGQSQKHEVNLKPSQEVTQRQKLLPWSAQP